MVEGGIGKNTKLGLSGPYLISVVRFFVLTFVHVKRRRWRWRSTFSTDVGAVRQSRKIFLSLNFNFPSLFSLDCILMSWCKKLLRIDFGAHQRLSERKFTQQITQYESWSRVLIPQWNKLLWCLLSTAVAWNFKYHTHARTKKLEH